MRAGAAAAALLVLAASGTAAQEEGDCARLGALLAEGPLPALWEDEADEIAEVVASGRAGACLAMLDLIRPSAPTGPADLPPACIRLRALLAADGPPAEAEEGLDGFAQAVGAGDAEGCAAGLEAIGAR